VVQCQQPQTKEGIAKCGDQSRQESTRDTSNGEF